ncbi:hypothetical protein [Actinoplanes sp. HUAS TT8]|uniref:hypothetical protein n=1 Tax=Actinoplanes sp. HUAS TT8 TaxID=3447453 RepID=UPI003F51AF36
MVDGAEPGRAGAKAELPLMSDAFPELVAEIDRLLGLDDPLDQLIGTVGVRRFHGRCTCTAGCGNILTALPGSPGPYVLGLERDGLDVIWLNLDPAGTDVVSIEVLDPSDLDLDHVEPPGVRRC